jgi:argonaute-like protein implicated in RNA metabolism and viral defense
MIKLYSNDFEKRYIKRILGKNWEVEEFNETFFTIVDDEKSTVKVEFDTFGEIWVDTINLFMYEPIYFRDGSYINELKAIIKLYENKEDLKEFICKFIQAMDPMYESIRILKMALQ